MATLDAEARDLVIKINAYNEFTERAKDRLPELKEELETLEGEVETEFSDLVEDVNEFLKKVRDETQALAEECEETGNALTDLENTVKSTQGDAAAAVGESQGDLAELKDQATRLVPEVEGLVADAAEKPGQALEETATDVLRQLDEALDETRDFLGQEVAQELQSLQTLTESWAEVVLKSFTDAGEHLNEVYVEWAGKIAEVEDLVAREGFTKAQAHAKECVEYALEDCKTDHETRLNLLSNLVDTTAGLLEELKDAFEEEEGEIKEGQEALTNAMDEMKEAIDAATQALDDVAQLLAQYAFVQMS